MYGLKQHNNTPLLHAQHYRTHTLRTWLMQTRCAEDLKLVVCDRGWRTCSPFSPIQPPGFSSFSVHDYYSYYFRLFLILRKWSISVINHTSGINEEKENEVKYGNLVTSRKNKITHVKASLLRVNKIYLKRYRINWINGLVVLIM